MDGQELAIKVGKSAAMISFATAIGFLISFVFKIVLARFLGPADFGVFSIISVILGILTTVLTFGIPPAMTKYVSDFFARKKDMRPLIYTSFTLTSAAMFLCVALMFFLAPELTSVLKIPNYVYEVRLISVVAAFTILNNYMHAISAGFQNFKITSLAIVLERIAKVAVVFVFLFLGFGIRGVIFGMLASIILSNLYIWSATRKMFKLGFGLNSRVRDSIFRFGLPVLVGSMASVVLGATDTFMLSIMRDPLQVGYYSAALPIMWYLGFPIAAMASALFPAFSELLAKGKRADIGNALSRSLKYTLIFLVPASIGVLILADPVVRILFGVEYSATVPVLRVLSIAALLSGMTYSLGSYYSGTGQPKKFMKYTIIAALVNLVANYFLIQQYEIVGAGIASTISLLTMVTLALNEIRQKVKLRWDYLPALGVSTFLMSIIVIPILKSGIEPLAKIPIIAILGAGVFFVLMDKLKAFTEEDKQLGRELFQRMRKRFSI